MMKEAGETGARPGEVSSPGDYIEPELDEIQRSSLEYQPAIHYFWKSLHQREASLTLLSRGNLLTSTDHTSLPSTNPLKKCHTSTWVAEYMLLYF